jgi:hypothetical protein
MPTVTGPSAIVMKSTTHRPSATNPPIRYPMVAPHEREIFVVVFSFILHTPMFEQMLLRAAEDFLAHARTINLGVESAAACVVLLDAR